MKRNTEKCPTMPFGKYKGRKLDNVPAGYLLYIYDNMRVFWELKQYIEDHYQILQKENEEYLKHKDCDATESDIY